jgi:hypothetical protein
MEMFIGEASLPDLSSVALRHFTERRDPLQIRARVEHEGRPHVARGMARNTQQGTL